MNNTLIEISKLIKIRNHIISLLNLINNMDDTDDFIIIAIPI